MKADALTLGQRIRHGWNAFLGREQQIITKQDLGPVYYSRPDRTRYRFGNERTIISSIYTRIAVDVCNYTRIRHVRINENEELIEFIPSGLDNCLTTDANMDQTGRAFRKDLMMKILDDGVGAAVPVDTSVNPRLTGSYDIQTMRAAKVSEWFPQHVKLDLYNDRTGNHEEIILPKQQIAIIENPLYEVMNEPISTLKRLVYKLALLDTVDEQSSSGKLDLIIQLPYTIKTELRRQEAEKRRRDIETQLTGNRYGIAYTDGTEKITQLSRSVENKLLDQINDLTSMLYSQLGMTKEVFEGTADEATMRNYINRTIEPYAAAIAEEMNRKFITKTARTQRQRVMYFYDIFKFATLESIATNGSQLVTSEVVTRNEVRGKLGFKPSDDPNADTLMNPNINPHGDAPMQGMPMDANGMPMDPNGMPVAEENSGEPTLAEMKVSEIP